MAAESQVLIDNEKKYIAKFFSDASESDVKKVDLSTLAWAKHTLTLSGAASPNFKIGEVITVALENKKKDIAQTFLNKQNTDPKGPESQEEITDGSRNTSTN